MKEIFVTEFDNYNLEIEKLKSIGVDEGECRIFTENKEEFYLENYKYHGEKNWEWAVKVYDFNKFYQNCDYIDKNIPKEIDKYDFGNDIKLNFSKKKH